MHEPIREHLEDFLTGSALKNVPDEFRSHLDSCPACKAEMDAFRSQSELMQLLRVPAGIEPRSGFYGRLMNRIEAQGPESFWSFFLVPSFGRRISFACGAMVLLLGSYIASSEYNLHEGGNAAVVALPPAAQRASLNNFDDEVRPQQRNAVLASLASFHE